MRRLIKAIYGGTPPPNIDEEALRRALGKLLNTRWYRIIHQHYGLAGGRRMTHQQIGAVTPNLITGKVGISGGRIWQIEHRILRILRHPRNRVGWERP